VHERRYGAPLQGCVVGRSCPGGAGIHNNTTSWRIRPPNVLA
jgi:hypothetical protein